MRAAARTTSGHNEQVLGVHFARRVDVSVEAGSKAVLALRREGYRKTEISLAPILRYTCQPTTAGCSSASSRSLPVDNLKKELVKRSEPVFESIAFQGVGVFETLKEVARQVLIELKKG